MKRMISTKAAEVAESIKDYVKQNNKTTEFGGNVEIDGNLTVNGSAPGGGGVNVYLCTDGGDATVYGNTISFIIITSKTIESFDDVKNYFKQNNLINTSPYPCNGFYKHAAGGTDSSSIAHVWLEASTLKSGYFSNTTYETITISSLLVKKLS